MPVDNPVEMMMPPTTDMGRLARRVMFVLLLSACGGEEPRGALLPENAADAVATYAAIARASYGDSLAEAEALSTATTALVADPSVEALISARAAWLSAREPYLQTEVFRFYSGPIDNPLTGPEGKINAWPLDEAYIDYVEGDEEAGIINDPGVTIDAASLESLNEQGGEENVATGYHAIEFLLWGQDRSPDGPGARPHTDYVADGSGTASHQDRRGLYLTTVTGLLVGHLEGLVEAWSTAPDSYRSGLLNQEPDQGMLRILTGMVVLSGFETGGERLQTALDSGSQEDEHSCFSDNTHRDMIQDVQGLQNIWRGSYERLDGSTVSGVGVVDVVSVVDPEQAERIGGEIDRALSLANALVPPFDQEIAEDNREGRARVEALIDSLQRLETHLREAMRTMELGSPR